MTCEPHLLQKRRNLPGEDWMAPSTSRRVVQRNFSRGTAVTDEKSCAVRLAAGLAVAMHDAFERRVGFVGDGAARGSFRSTSAVLL